MKLQREMVIDSLEQMCDLMCGGVEEEYDDSDLVCDTEGEDCNDGELQCSE